MFSKKYITDNVTIIIQNKFFCSLWVKAFKSPISFTSCFISKTSLSNNSSEYSSGFGIFLYMVS